MTRNCIECEKELPSNSEWYKTKPHECFEGEWISMEGPYCYECMLHSPSKQEGLKT